MDHFAGLDVSVKETSVCILDDVGKILKEVKVASELDIGAIEQQDCSMLDWTSAANGALLMMPEAPWRRLATGPRG
jgi:hypothetical protein